MSRGDHPIVWPTLKYATRAETFGGVKPTSINTIYTLAPQLGCSFSVVMRLREPTEGVNFEALHSGRLHSYDTSRCTEDKSFESADLVLTMSCRTWPNSRLNDSGDQRSLERCFETLATITGWPRIHCSCRKNIIRLNFSLG